MKKLIIILSLVITGSSAIAQQNLTLYNMYNVQQRQYANPALRPAARINIGFIPGLTSNYFNVANTGFTLNHLIKKANDTSAILDINNFESKLARKNILSATADIDIFSFGFKQKKNYWSGSLLVKQDVRLMYPKGIFTLLIKGNAASDVIDQQLNLGLKVDNNTYTELGIGFNREFTDKLVIGAKLKYLMGIANVYTKRANVSFTTETDTLYLRAQSDIAVYSSGANLIGTNNFNVNNYLFKNNGVGLDLGVNYKFTEKLSASASIIDLGFIRWNNINSSIVSANRDAELIFKGVDIKQFLNSAVSNNSTQATNQANQQLDSLRNLFKIDTILGNAPAYISPLFTKLYVAGNYDINKWSAASALFYGQIYARTIQPAATIAYHLKARRWLHWQINYSYLNRSFLNVGTGLSLNLGPLQWHIMSDNILGPSILTRYRTNNTTTIPLPSYLKTVNLRFGFNLAIGRKPLDKDKDGIPDKLDDCPTIAGLKEFKGCPDKDGDRIPDKDDACPDVAGSVEFKGCSDKDGDKIIDKDDACPDVAGTIETKGCPDKDKDGIIDTEDECPDVAGLKQFMGCPDKDGDGIIDKIDECPELAGTKEYNGCPDTDGDGIADNKDLCVTEKGPLENKGCPYKDKDGDGVLDKEDKCPEVPGPADNKGCPFGDADGDKVLDKDDQCPNTPGPADNKGCPKLEKQEEEVLKAAFNNLEFETGKDVIKDVSFDELNELANLLKKKTAWKLKMSGHTDNQGNPKANMDLSKRRAAAVKKFLSSKGIEETRLTSEGFGQTKPVANNKTPEGRQRNRRVEMKVLFE